MNDDIIEGRLIDIPYRTSPPVLFVYQQTASILAGQYTFPAGARIPFTPSRPINANSLYIFNTLDFACDLDQNDYMGAIVSALSFSVYLQSDMGPTLREPIPMVKYFNSLPYILNILGNELLGEAYQNSSGVSPNQGFTFNRLMGNMIGVLNQTAPIIGKISVTSTVVFTATEITDKNFIADFKARADGNINLKSPQNNKPQIGGTYL